MKANFIHDGSLPAQFQDFYSVDGQHPHVTLVTRRSADPEEVDEGWLFIVVDAEQITEENSREAIAAALDLPCDCIELAVE